MSASSASRTLRIGVLGAATIVPAALLRPMASVGGVEVVAIAARDRSRASTFAAKHRIPVVHGSYEDLLADPEVDAVYVPLPASLHARWTIAAIDAGKHVLCEKPFTSNAAAAAEVAAVAAASTVVVMEAYHSHFHPLRRRLHEILDSGELGRIRSVSAVAAAPIPPGRDIRWDLALGGGGLLDLGYYPLRLLRDLFGEVRPLSVTARSRGGVDARLEARLGHDSGVESRLVSAMWSWPPIASRIEVHGSAGRMRVGTPTHPQLGGVIRIANQHGRRVERPTRRSSYTYQLEAFRDAVLGAPVETGPEQAIAQLTAIDELYRAAGLAPRPSAPATTR